MAKARRKPQLKKSIGGRTGTPRPRLAPERWLLGLAGLGLLLTTYLLVVHLSGGNMLFCTEGSSCEVVQESRWATLLGLPMALWGMGLYAALALVASTGSNAATRWRRLFSLSLIGVLISVYLTAMGWFTLEALCGWCLVSLALLLVIFAWVVLRRPSQTPASGWSRWLAMHAIVLLPGLALMAAAQAGWLSPPDDPRLEPLAEHLRDSGAKFYGTFWCPECQQQKRRFGRSADQLPYVECAANGRNGPMAFECAQQGIERYPTWIIRGQRYTGVLEPSELARQTRFHKWNVPATDTAGK